MRVLYILPAEGFGGAERQGVTHIRTLLDLGLEVVPVVGPGRLIRKILRDAGVHDYVFAPDFPSQSEGPATALEVIKGKIQATRSWFAMQRLLDRLIVERRIELVFASRAPGWMVGSPSASRQAVPLVWRGGSRLTSPLEVAGLRVLHSLWRPDALVVNCEAVRRDLAPLLGCPSYVVPNGVDLRRFDPDRAAPRFRDQLGLQPGVPTIGLAARPAPEKGLEFLAEAIARTAERVPALRLLVGGEFGWRSYYQTMFENLGLGSRVSFLGHVDEVEAFYQSCNVIVLTSRESSIEGSPNALLEAMAMRRPVLATRVGGVAEVIEHGVEGFLVHHDDVPGFTHYLALLLQNPGLRTRLGAAGRAAVLRRHDDRSVGLQLASLFREVAARVERRPRRAGHVRPAASAPPQA